MRSSSVLLSALCIVFSLLLTVVVYAEEPVGYGADVNPTDDPIGGGLGYSRSVTTGDYVVATAQELLSALNSANAGEVVFVVPSAEIDLTGMRGIVIPGGVTLASTRGIDGSGALIYSDEMDTNPLFRVGGPNVRITGLRLRGPDPNTQNSAYELPNSAAISTNFDHLEVDNNEIFNWSYAGVHVNTGRDAHIHHNFIHHVRRAGLGYPVVVVRGTALIEANEFDWARHAIAGSGYSGSGYEARFNLVGPNSTSHSFDMHGGRDRGDGTDIAGERIHIHHNTFLATHVAGIVIRGVPEDVALVHNNWFLHATPSRALQQTNATGGIWMYDNVYGASATPSDEAPEGLFWVDFPATTVRSVRGTFTPQFQIQAFPGAEIANVSVQVDDRTIYSGAAVPGPGQLAFDTEELEDGWHTLTVRVEGVDGRATVRAVRLQIENWWRLTDELEPPVDVGGWFGVFNRDLTEDQSDGWIYAEEDPDSFFGDATRKTRKTLTEEYLIWNAPQLREFSATAYLTDLDDVSKIRLAITQDGSEWVALQPKVEAEGPNSAGWFRVALDGDIADGLNASQIKLTIEADATNEIQVGRVELRGWNRD